MTGSICEDCRFTAGIFISSKTERDFVYTKGNADEGFDVCGVSYNNPTEEMYFWRDGMTDVMLADDQEHILCRRYDGAVRG